jgi:hypothetical protein
VVLPVRRLATMVNLTALTPAIVTAILGGAPPNHITRLRVKRVAQLVAFADFGKVSASEE